MTNHIYVPQDGEVYVYVYWNPLKTSPQFPNGTPFYVGKGTGQGAKSNRALSHLLPCARNSSYKSRTIAAIERSGATPLVTCMWRGSDEDKASWVERFAIAMWKRKSDGGILTNVTTGGEGSSGRRNTAHTLTKMSQAQQGHSVSPEQRAKISATLTGRRNGPLTVEHRQKISTALRAKKKQPQTEATKQKRAFKNAKRYIVTFPDGHEEAIHNMSAFCAAHRLSNGSMCEVANGHRTHHKGFKATRSDK